MDNVIDNFVKLFGAKLRLDKKLVVRRGSRYFLLSRNIFKLARENGEWLYAGKYLGKVEGGVFHPSFPLLSMVAEKAKNKVTVDDKAAWLFVCGRDLFKDGIVKVEGSKEKGAYTVIFNKHGECLGFGRIVKNLDALKSGVAVENLFDVGDFLRRERRVKL